jgi:hypothetical protein
MEGLGGSQRDSDTAVGPLLKRTKAEGTYAGACSASPSLAGRTFFEAASVTGIVATPLSGSPRFVSFPLLAV